MTATAPDIAADATPAETIAAGPPAPLPAPTAPTAAATPIAAAPALSPIATERMAVEGVLNNYREAFTLLDAGRAAVVWPSVDERALSRAFERLEQQEVTFDKCTITVIGPRADASCAGEVRYVPKVGSRGVNTEARQWKFILRKVRESWTIETVVAR
jgi:hypothetical protein